MFMEERQKMIVDMVNASGHITVNEIQEHFKVSSDCVRRDLRSLESRGLLKRTHGGAISTGPIGKVPEKIQILTSDALRRQKRQWNIFRKMM